MNRRNFLKSAALAGMSGAVAGSIIGAGASGLQAAERTAGHTGNTGSIRNFNPDMRYRTFGKTGEKVSALGYGTMRMPVVGNDYGRIDRPESLRLMGRALEGGLNYIDTSWPYHSTVQSEGGDSEPFVGECVTRFGRDRFHIATKLPIWAVNARADMDRFLDAQLRRLNTDHVDFYLVHNIMEPTWRSIIRHDLRDFLDKALQSGKVRHVGFSFHDKPELYQEVMDYYDWSFNQHVCNYYDINFQAGMRGIRQAALRGMGFVAMEGQMSGMLSTQLPQEALDVLNATGIRRSPAAWAFRWVWDNPEVSVCLTGMNKMEHVEENLRTAQESDIPLTAAEVAALDKVRAILKGKNDIPCTECGKCSCPRGVNIMQCFQLYGVDRAFKEVPRISHANYGLAMKGMPKGAENCDGCGSCSGQCPEGIDIPANLKKVAAHFAHARTGW